MAQQEEDLIQFDEPPRFWDIKISSFWSDRPASWFTLVEARFPSHGIIGEQAKFDQVVGALSKFWTRWRCSLSSTPTQR